MSYRGIPTIGRSGVAALVALAFVLLALPAAASAAADGGISGKVTWAAGGAAVEGAEVCAETEGEAFDFECAETAVDGSYEITGLEPAKYLVFFVATESSPYVVFQAYPTEVTVTSAATTPGINAAVEKGGAFAGTVVDANSGLPLVNVEVCAWLEEVGGGEELDGCDYTDSAGGFTLIGLHAGPHSIEFWPEAGYEPQFFAGKTILSGSTLNVNAALVREASAEGRISGHVYATATHAPLGGIAVCAIDQFNESRGCAHTSKAGAYEFIQVPAEPWRIAFSPAPTEFEPFEPGEIPVDAWPTQFWNLKPTLAQADMINIGPTAVVTGIDGLLGPGRPRLQTT